MSGFWDWFEGQPPHQRSDPELQNLPLKTEEGALIRKALAPRKGVTEADFLPHELRVLKKLKKGVI